MISEALDGSMVPGANCVPNTLLGAGISMAHAPLYALYVATAAVYGIDPTFDQQLAGLIMWIPGDVLFASILMLLFVALVLITFALLTIAPDAIAQLRKHHWRWWWRTPDDDGPYWPGTRIPRH